MVLWSCFAPENLAYNKTKKRGSRERSSPPCQIKILILPRCPEARGNIDFDHAGATLTDHVCAPSNGFRAAVYDQHRPRHWCSRAVNSGTRWLPELMNLRLKVVAGNPPSGPRLATKPQSFSGRLIVCAPFRRVELFSTRFRFSVRECCVTDTSKQFTVGAFHHRGGAF